MMTLACFHMFINWEGILHFFNYWKFTKIKIIKNIKYQNILVQISLWINKVLNPTILIHLSVIFGFSALEGKVWVSTKEMIKEKLGESYEQPRQHIKKQRHNFVNKGPSSQSYGFSSSHVWMWE